MGLIICSLIYMYKNEGLLLTKVIFIFIMILTIPLVIGLTRNQNFFTALPVYIVTLTITIIFVSLFYMMRNLHYEVNANGLVINMGLQKKKIAFEDITGVQTHVSLGNSYRVRGLSDVPGFFVGGFQSPHWGLVYLYGTNNLDVLLLQTRDSIFAISPENQEELVAVIEAGRQGNHLTPTGEIRPDLAKERGGKLSQDIVALVLILSGFLMILIFFGTLTIAINRLPESVPLHYGISGRVDRYGSPKELYIMPVMATYFWLMISFFGFAFYRENKKSARGIWGISLGVVVFLTVLIFLNIFSMKFS